MSTILVPHCEFCKKLVAQEELDINTEGYEICRPCMRAENKQKEIEYLADEDSSYSDRGY